MVRFTLAFVISVLGGACAPSPDAADPLDHTPYVSISRSSECRCLQRKKLVVSPSNPVACYSPGTDNCGIRIDCVAPEANELTRREALACRDGTN